MNIISVLGGLISMAIALTILHLSLGCDLNNEIITLIQTILEGGR